MNINIETKFNIGDTVFVTELKDNWSGEYYTNYREANKNPQIITGITCKVNSDSEKVRIEYSLKNCNSKLEREIFISYEEARKSTLNSHGILMR